MRLKSYNEETHEVEFDSEMYYNLHAHVHDLNDVENHLKIGTYKVLFILSCAISCLIYYSGVVIFPLSAKRIRDEFQYGADE